MRAAPQFEERLSEESGAGAPLDWFMHQARYLFAAGFAAGLDVLDIACGTGYGSALLARHGARSVTGVDISAEALDEARRRHEAPGVRFLQGDALELPARGPFDMAVSFETIEHVADPGRMLDELAGCLMPDGVLVCSSPNRDVTGSGRSRHDPPANPFHVVELTRRELRAELDARFREVRLSGQAYRLPVGRAGGRRATRASEALARATAWPVRLPLAPLYVVAVCRGPFR